MLALIVDLTPTSPVPRLASPIDVGLNKSARHDGLPPLIRLLDWWPIGKIHRKSYVAQDTN
jgi:hypothetical protein